jgi:hypothetical protein
LFCSFSYYFMPFMAIVLNMKYMVWFIKHI